MKTTMKQANVDEKLSRVSVRVPESQYKKVQELADLRNVSISYLIVQSVLEMLKNCDEDEEIIIPA